MTEDEKELLSHFDNSPFMAKDKRVYTIKKLVSVVLNTDLTEDEITRLKEGLDYRTNLEPEYKGSKELVDLAISARASGLRGLGGTFGLGMILPAVIKFYAEILTDGPPEGEPFEFNDSYRDVNESKIEH